MPSSCREWTIVTPVCWITTIHYRQAAVCILNAAARLVTGTRQLDHDLSHLLHEELPWLDVPERIHYKLGVTVHRCLQYKHPEYLVDCCTPDSDIPSRRHLQSATVHHLTVPRYWLSTCDRWAFWSGTRYQSPRPGAYQQQQPQTIAEDDPTRLVFSDCLRLLQSTCTRYFNATTQHRQRSKDASRVCAKTIIDIDIGNGTIH